MCIIHCSEISSRRSGELSYTVPKLNPKDKIGENLPLVSSVLSRNFDSIFVLGPIRRFASTVGHAGVLVGCKCDSTPYRTLHLTSVGHHDNIVLSSTMGMPVGDATRMQI